MERLTVPYLGLLIVIGFSMASIGGVYWASRAISIEPRPVESLPFQSGWMPREHALSRFHARWYPLTLIFLAFDIEMLFMYPWALVVSERGLEAVNEMFVFLGILMIGVVWAWREGALRWV